MERSRWGQHAMAGGLLILTALVGCRGAAVRQGPEQAFVEAEIAEPVDRVEAQILKAFHDGRASPDQPTRLPPGDWLAPFYLFPRLDPPDLAVIALPDDFQLRSNCRDDAAMDWYLALPSVARARDWYLHEPTGDHYWPSEYERGGRPVDFACDFVLHLEPVGESHTRVEVLESRSRVRLGRKLAPFRHGIGIGWVADIRLVPPTVGDRQRVLSRIVAAVGAP